MTVYAALLIIFYAGETVRVEWMPTYEMCARVAAMIVW